MDDSFKIYVEQLKDGHTETIDEKFGSEFLDIKEEQLSFQDPVHVTGEAYLAEDSFILQLNVETIASIRCSICNEPVKVPIEIKNLYHVEPLSEIKTAIFNFKDVLRENILLETPRFAECMQGNCPQREQIKKYLKKPDAEDDAEDEKYHPFADFKWDK